MQRLHSLAFTLRNWRYFRLHRCLLRELVADIRGEHG